MKDCKHKQENMSLKMFMCKTYHYRKPMQDSKHVDPHHENYYSRGTYWRSPNIINHLTPLQMCIWSSKWRFPFGRSKSNKIQQNNNALFTSHHPPVTVHQSPSSSHHPQVTIQQIEFSNVNRYSHLKFVINFPTIWKKPWNSLVEIQNKVQAT